MSNVVKEMDQDVDAKIKIVLDGFNGTYSDALEKCRSEIPEFTTNDHFTVFSTVIGQIGDRNKGSK